jgi:hypothetical protein
MNRMPKPQRKGSMDINRRDTAVLVTDPQNDILSEQA